MWIAKNLPMQSMVIIDIIEVPIGGHIIKSIDLLNPME